MAVATKCTTIPADSQTIILLDSTYGLISGPGHTSISTSSAYLAPGNFRYRWQSPNAVRTVVKNGNQAVTIKFEVLTGNAGTSSDWEEDSDAPSAGSATAPLSDTSTYEWKPSAPDWRVRVVAGADNPDSFVATVEAQWAGFDYGT